MVKIIGFEIDEYYPDLFQEDNHIYNGNQFTTLCRELLGSTHNIWLPLKNDYTIWPLSNGIPDGGIDIIAVNKSNHSEIFFQCKYKKDGRAAEATLKEIYAALKTNLKANASKRYLPWKTHSVNKYVICLSFGLNLGTVDHYKYKFRELFDLISQQSGMEHLKGIDVIILYDTIFKDIIVNDQVVARNWLVSQTSVEVLDTGIKSQEKRFSNFLDSEHLDYFSRHTFKKSLTTEQAENFEDEEDLLGYLSQSKNRVVIIYGQGGLGKTRLTLEVGRKAKSDYTVLRVKNMIKNLNELLYVTRKGEKYLLLFDYIEEHSIFFETIRWLVEEDIQHIKVVANCRTTFFKGTVKESLGSDEFKCLDISPTNPLESRYKNEVVRFIISTITDKKLAERLKSNQILQSFCEDRPAFAVFIKYLNSKKPGHEYLINKDTSFERWLLARLKLTLEGNRDCNLVKNHKEVFKIMSCLPATGIVRRKIKKDFLEKITLLIHDGWIDDDGQTIGVVHDTVNDILLSYLLGHFNYEDILVEELLDFSIVYESLPSMLRSIERIWTDRSITIDADKRLNLQTHIGKTIRLAIDQTMADQNWFSEQLPYTPLIGEVDRIEILYEFRDLLAVAFSREQYGHSLSYSMNWIVSHLHRQQLDFYLQWLKTLFYDYWNVQGRFDDFSRNPALGGRLISTYIKLFGIDDYITQQFDTYLSHVPRKPENLEYISFVLVAWLWDKKASNGAIEEMIPEWVNAFKEKRHDPFNPGFLLEAWCKFGKPVALINSLVLSCLRNDGMNINVRADMIGYWLENGNDPLLVKPFIASCLTSKITPKTAFYIMGFWLKVGNEPLLVEPFLAKWLDCSMEAQMFSVIFKNWLHVGDNPDLILPAIQRWCRADSSPRTIGNVLYKFIEKGGNTELIEGEIICWLEQNTASETAVNILKVWLDRSISETVFFKLFPIITVVLNTHLPNVRDTGRIVISWVELGYELSAVTPFVTNWLDLYNDELHAGFLIRLWLEKDNSNVLVKPYVKLFLAQFDQFKEASSLISAWIVKGDDPLIIRDHLERLLENFAEEPGIRFVITAWLEKAADPELVKSAIIRWIGKNADLGESVYVVSFWLRYGNDCRITENYIINNFGRHLAVKDSNNVIETWLMSGGARALIIPHVTGYLELSPLEKNSIWVAHRWLHNGEDPLLIEAFIFTRFTEYCVYRESNTLIKLCLEKYGQEQMLPVVNAYLAFHCDRPEAVSLIRAWICEGLDSALIVPQITEIDQQHGENFFGNKLTIVDGVIHLLDDKEVAYEYQTQIGFAKKIFDHLKNNGNPETIKGEVELYLKKYGRTIDATWVISAWIEYGSDFELVKRTLIKWLELHFLTQEKSSFIIGVALEHPEAFAIVKVYALDWLAKYGLTFEAKFVLSSWLVNDSLDPNAVASWVDYWITHHSSRVEEKNNKPLHWRDKRLWEDYNKRQQGNYKSDGK